MDFKYQESDYSVIRNFKIFKNPLELFNHIKLNHNESYIRALDKFIAYIVKNYGLRPIYPDSMARLKYYLNKSVDELSVTYNDELCWQIENDFLYMFHDFITDIEIFKLGGDLGDYAIGKRMFDITITGYRKDSYITGKFLYVRKGISYLE